MKRKIQLVITLLILVAYPASSQAITVTCTNCSTNLVQQLDNFINQSQLANIVKQYAEDMVQTEQQIRMVWQNVEQYANMVQNTIALPKELIGEVTGTMNRLAVLSNKLKTSRGDIMALGDIFGAMYQEKAVFEKMTSAVGEQMQEANALYQKHWSQWAGRVDEAVQATFQLSGQQLDDLQQDSVRLDDYIGQLLSTPDGQMKAIQAGNQLAALQVQESRQLRELVATQAQSALASQMKTEKESQMEREAWRKAINVEEWQGAGSKNAKVAP